MFRVSSAKVFRKEESISKVYLSKNSSTFFFFGNLDVNFVVTVFDPNEILIKLMQQRKNIGDLKAGING